MKDLFQRILSKHPPESKITGIRPSPKAEAWAAELLEKYQKREKNRSNQDSKKGETMNKYQRIILTVGAVFLVLMLNGLPTVQYGPNSIYSRTAETVDIPTAIVRILVVVGAISLLFFAFKGIGKKKQEKEENVLQGVSVEKFISHLEAKGVDLKKAKVVVTYNGKPVK